MNDFNHKFVQIQHKYDFVVRVGDFLVQKICTKCNLVVCNYRNDGYDFFLF